MRLQPADRTIWDVAMSPSLVAVQIILKSLLVLITKVFISIRAHCGIYFITYLFPLTIRGASRLRGRSRFRNSGDGNVRNDDASNPVRRLCQYHVRMLPRWRHYREWYELCGMRCHRYRKLHRILLWMLSRWGLRRYTRRSHRRSLPLSD
jgi:hypothetical protein